MCEIIKRKLVIVGDGACGKTSLLHVFTSGRFVKDYNPTVFDGFTADCRVDGKLVRLALWDTAGQEEYDRLRPLLYNNAHVVLVAFSVDRRASFENAKLKWVEEAWSKAPNVTLLLVGLKTDLRDWSGNDSGYDYNFVTRYEGEEVARAMGCRSYIECSAYSGDGVYELFERATRCALLQGDCTEPRNCCLVL